MKKSVSLAVMAGAAVFGATSAFATPIDPTTELGAAGPNNFAVIDYGNFSISFNPTTANINGQVVVEGEVNGNLADYKGNVTTSTSGQLNGTTYLGPSASGGAGSQTLVTGSGVPASVLSIAFGSGFGPGATFGAGGVAQYYATQSANFISIGAGATAAGTTTVGGGHVNDVFNLASGVYNLSSLNPSGTTYKLTAGQVYVFNISGDFSPSGGTQFLDSTPGDVIFNVGGKVSTSGGVDNPGEVEIDGILLAQGSISLTPGYVIPEIISDESINIASGGGVQGQPSPPAVPDNGSTFVLLGLGCLGLVFGVNKLQNRRA